MPTCTTTAVTPLLVRQRRKDHQSGERVDVAQLMTSAGFGVQFIDGHRGGFQSLRQVQETTP
jgi:hypothetical protein